MSKHKENEMEQIQKSLEKFLQQEMEGVIKTDGEDIEDKNDDEDDEEYDDEEYDDEEYEDDEYEEDDEEQYEIALKKEKRKIKKVQKKAKKIEKKKAKKKMEKQGKYVKPKKKGRLSRDQEPKKKGGFHRFLTVLILLLLLLGGFWYWAVGAVYNKMESQPVGELSKEPMKDKGVLNVLLIGSDSRTQEEEGRSDAMILLSISSKTNTIHMTSLLRDMYVEIPGHDGNRLNAAYAFGGAELLLETVSTNLGIEVNRYMVVNFEAFANLVDAVGGVELTLTNEEVQWVNAYLNEYNLLRNMPIETDYLDATTSGNIKLNGPQALAYSRNRYIGTDFGRTERQRKVLAEVFGKLPGAVIKNPKGLMDGLFSNLTTNLSKAECVSLSLTVGKLITHDIIQNSIPLEGTYKDAKIRGMAVLEVDFEANQKYIRTEIYGIKE